MKIDLKAEIADELEKFVTHSLFQELPAQDIQWITNGRVFTLFLSDRIDIDQIKERITQTYGSKVKIRQSFFN